MAGARRWVVTTVEPEDISDPYLPLHGNPGYTVRHYDLDLDYRVATNRLAGRAQLTVLTLEALSGLSLDLAQLRVTKVVADTRRVTRFSRRGDKLHVSFDRPVPAGSTVVLDIAYGGSPRPLAGLCGDVGWEELSDGVIVAGQPDGAPSWFPCNDLPSEKASYAIAVTTESPYTVVANGRLVDGRVRASRTTWVYEQAEPMATYLATVQVGRYERRTHAAAVPLHMVVPARLRRDAAHDLERQPEMLVAFQDMFGPYPFADYTVVVTDDELEIPLEAQGLSVFGANHVDGARGSERLVAHELAHQWFGNSLTVGRWRDIWLHEGFACYAEWLWSERADGLPADDYARDAWDRLAALPQDLLLVDPGPDLMFDDRLYKRGALTLHAMRRSIGDDRFFGVLRSWATTHRHGSVSTAAFLAHVEQQTDGAVVQLLTQWLDTRPLPRLP
jgi:aminopeptidase N